MRRTSTKGSLMSLATGFFLFGFWLLFGTAANAQGMVWMQADQAQIVLSTEVENYHNVLKSATPGTPLYQDALRHTYYYKNIYQLTTQGMDVETATYQSLSIFPESLNPSQGYSTAKTVSDVTASKVQVNLLLQDAINLLTL